MPNFTVDQIREIMDDPRQIRNMSVIAHVDHGKSTLTDSLIARAGIIADANAGNARVTDTRQDEKDRGITIKSTGVSLYFETDIVEQGLQQPYLINVIDSPGHVDFSSEVTAALRVTDGALVVVDYIEGVCVQTETVLRQALAEKIKPVVIINKVDRGILEQQVDGETMYQNFLRVIENTNVIISTYEFDQGSNDSSTTSLQVCPTEGTVAFGAALFGWAFTLTGFAKYYSQKFKISQDLLKKKLWGDNYYNPATKKFQNTDQAEDGKKLQRSFVQFIMRPIIQMTRNIMNGNVEAVWKMLEPLGISLKANERELRSKPLMKCVFQKWLNAADALLEMIILRLPSPKEAQAYRAAHLYEGPIDDPCGQAMMNCDKDGPLMIYISKMVPTNNKGRFYAFGRVFSGTVQNGQKVRIMGPNYQPGSRNDLHVKNIQRTLIMMGDKAESLPDVPCGCTVALAGVDQYLVKQGTLSDYEEAYCIKAMKYSVSPVVRVAVDVMNASDLPKLIDGLKKLAKSDPLVLCQTTDSGQHVVAGSGELHVEICLKDLEEVYAQCPIRKGEPVVSYKETVSDESAQVCLAKSKNKLNRIFASAMPLGEELTNAIEENKVTAVQDARQRSTILHNTFDWDPNDSRKVWCFGPETTGPNIIVDQTSQAQYLREIRDSIEAGFQWVTKEGALTEENQRGIRYNIVDVMAHQDNSHRGGDQIIPATRRALLAAQLTAQPRFQEPVFFVQIQTTCDTVGSIYQSLAQRRGQVQSEEPVPGTPLVNLTAYLPVAESFGLTDALRMATGGRAFPQCVFDHWEELNADPLDPASRAGVLAQQIRLRKGLPADIPQLANFLDRL